MTGDASRTTEPHIRTHGTLALCIMFLLWYRYTQSQFSYRSIVYHIADTAVFVTIAYSTTMINDREILYCNNHVI